MNLSDLNPFIRYARAHSVAFHTGKELSICYDCRVFFFDNISGSVTINGNTHQLYNKTVLFLPPETQYRFNILFKEHARIIILNFDLTGQNQHLQSSLGTATRSTFDPSRVPPYSLPEELRAPMLRQNPKAEHMLMQCVENFLYEPPYYRENASAILKLFLLDMISRSNLSDQSQLSQEVLSYVHSSYNSPTLTNKEIATRFGYHPDHLSTLIKEATGKTLHQYIISYRLQMAKNYLLTTQYDISEIAWRTGFCTPAYFIKLFRENTGLTPRAYRKLQIHTEL